MADELLTVVENLETVPEALRGYYREDNGRHILNASPVGSFELADTAALKKALNAERTAKENLAKSAKAYEKYKDVDLDAAIEAQQKLAEFDAGNIDMEAEVQRKLKAQADQLITQHEEVTAGLNSKNEKLMGKLRTLLIDNQAITAITEAKGNVKNLLPHVRDRVRVVETEDDYEIQVLTETGEPAVDGEAKPITIDALIKGFVKEFSFAFKGAESSGGGGAGKQSIAGTADAGKLVISQEEARDPVKYRAARERAAKEGLKLVMGE